MKKKESEASSYVFLASGAPFYGCMLRYKQAGATKVKVCAISLV